MATNPYASQQGTQNLGISGNSYGGSNPYLQQNIDKSMGDISRQYNKTIAPQRAGAMARSGSFGNSGQEQMQLEDQRNLGQTMADTTNQMRMADYTKQQSMYQQDQQNSLQNRSLDQQGALANRGMDISSRGQDLNYNLGMAGVGEQRYGTDTGAHTAMRGQDVNERVANAQNQTSRYGMDQQAATSRYGTDANTSIANQANWTQQRGQDFNRDIANQSNLTNMRGQDQSYSLGMGQNANQRRGIDNQYSLGQMQDQTQRYGYDSNARTQRQANVNQYDLGLRSSDYNFANLDSNINQNNFNNQMSGAKFGLGMYDRMQAGNNLGLQTGTQIQNTPLNYQNQYTNQVNAIAGGRGAAVPQIQAQQSSPLTGALGGMQLYNAWNQSRPPPVIDGGYSIGQGSAYGGNMAGM